MAITIKIDTDNTAFDEGRASMEVERILLRLTERLEPLPNGARFQFHLHDLNGNIVGEARGTLGN